MMSNCLVISVSTYGFSIVDIMFSKHTFHELQILDKKTILSGKCFGYLDKNNITIYECRLNIPLTSDGRARSILF